MSDFETITVCPLGHSQKDGSAACRVIKDNKVWACAWYTNLIMTNQDGEKKDSWACSLAHMPFMLVQVANTNRGQTAALESMRNEVVTEGERARQHELNMLNDLIKKADQTKPAIAHTPAPFALT